MTFHFVDKFDSIERATSHVLIGRNQSKYLGIELCVCGRASFTFGSVQRKKTILNRIAESVRVACAPVMYVIDQTEYVSTQ